MFGLYDTVILLRDTIGIPKGSWGKVVLEVGDGEAVIVEFIDDNGETLAVEVIERQHLRRKEF